MSITVRRTQIPGTAQTIQIGEHTLTVDASTAAGGADAGPDPHALYDAALGACKALTVLLYAQRRSIPVQDVVVQVDRDASQERQGTYRLSTQLQVSGELSDAQRDELLRVAGKCPIHRLMTEVTTEVDTRWADAPL